ncbi:hypothetical protein KIN20_036844, partial [Parelaphostrongylus tenuis]
EQFTDLIAESLSKPKGRVAVELLPGQRITHGGSRNPVVIVKVESIGALSSDDTIRHTQKITNFCQEVLKVPKEKVIISYYDLAPDKVGVNGSTVAATRL